MTREQAIQALERGIEIFRDESRSGLDAVGTGDMGIANTTPSSAPLPRLCFKWNRPGS